MRADRLMALLILLQTRGKRTAEDLANELHVSRRTILRDVEALSIAGVPIYAEGGHGGGIALDEQYRTNLTGLHEQEVRTLFLTSNAQLFQQLDLGEAAERTQLKLTAALPARHQAAVHHIRQRILIDPAWWWNDPRSPAFWEQLQQAVYEDRPIRSVYQNYNGEIVERRLEPYSLIAKSGTWYLVAKREQEFRIYRVSRFYDLTLLGEHFQREAEFDLPSYWESHLQEFAESTSEYTVTLKVHPDRVNFVKWLTAGRHQIIMPEHEGEWSIMRLQVESMDLAKMLVFGLGAQAVVIEPRELQEAVLDAVREYARRL